MSDRNDDHHHLNEPAPAPAQPDPVRDRWRAAMRLALAEAELAVQGGDVPVGAVVLSPDGTTALAAGHN
ncbi:MAG: hypothetical protein WCD21_15050, partial [Streptomyces sp.]